MTYQRRIVQINGSEVDREYIVINFSNNFGVSSSGQSVAINLSNTGITPGTYKSVSVDSVGRITSGTNPSTIAGYGITDAITSITTSNGLIGGGTQGHISLAIADNTVLPGSESVTLPIGSTLQRPSVTSQGMIRFNNSTKTVEYFNSTSWKTVSAFEIISEKSNSPLQPAATGNNSLALGSGSLASGIGAIAIGSNSTASGNYSESSGLNSSSTNYGQASRSNGRFTSNGDAQSSMYILRALTTDAIQTEMFLDGISQKIVLNDNTTWFFSISLAGRRTDVNGEKIAIKWEGAIDRGSNAASTTIMKISRTLIARDNTSWDVAIDADTTNGSLRLRVTGQIGKTIRWVAYVRTTEVSS